MKRMTKSGALAVALLISPMLVIGCGNPTPKPKNPNDVKGQGDIAATLPKKPKRKISGASKSSFADAVKRYKAAKKEGINKGNCGGIAEAFGGVYDNDSKVVEAKFNEGVVYEECGDLAKAEQVYRAILQKHPNHGATLNNMGQLLFARNQRAEAQTYFRKAAAAKNSEGYANLALLQRQRALGGETQALRDAVNNIHRALAVDSFNIEAYNLLSTLLYDHARTRSQLTMARLIAVQATKKEPKFAPVYNVLGLILLKMGKVTPALAEFRKAVARDPNFKEALMNIGAVTLSFRDYTSAEQAFTKVLSLNPDKETKYAATVGLGVALRGRQKFAEAMAQYQAAEKILPGNGDIAYNMGLIVQDYTFDASDPAKGIAQLQKAKGFLDRYMSSGSSKSQIKDTKRRLKNIKEMIPMLKQQQQMMESMKKNQPAATK